MTPTPHLTEDERQALAERSGGSLSADRARDAQEHLRVCSACAADVRALEETMMKIRSAASPAFDADASWPEIRARIEQSKVLSMPAGMNKATSRRGLRIAAGLAAAAAIIVLAVALPRARARSSDAVVAGNAAPTALVPVADSLQSYEAEARVLLDHLEVERALMRPEARAMIDRDLKVIDAAIDELNVAIANDPKNVGLRRLLAESYRQKVDLLKRAQNAS